jgi:hypothetical protein
VVDSFQVTGRLDVDRVFPDTRRGALGHVLVACPTPITTISARGRIAHVCHRAAGGRDLERSPRETVDGFTVWPACLWYVHVRILIFGGSHHFIDAAVRQSRGAERERGEGDVATPRGAVSVFCHNAEVVFGVWLQAGQFRGRAHVALRGAETRLRGREAVGSAGAVFEPVRARRPSGVNLRL